MSGRYVCKTNPHHRAHHQSNSSAQVWLGTALGFLLCLIVGAALIAIFYTAKANSWESAELNYEGAFCLIASVIITVVGAALLRIGKMHDKWRAKITAALDKTPAETSGKRTGKWAAFKRFLEKYAMFALPFVTVLREGIEAIVFVAGVSFQATATAVPLPVVVGLIAGAVVGYILYK